MSLPLARRIVAVTLRRDAAVGQSRHLIGNGCVMRSMTATMGEIVTTGKNRLFQNLLMRRLMWKVLYPWRTPWYAAVASPKL